MLPARLPPLLLYAPWLTVTIAAATWTTAWLASACAPVGMLDEAVAPPAEEADVAAPPVAVAVFDDVLSWVWLTAPVRLLVAEAAPAVMVLSDVESLVPIVVVGGVSRAAVTTGRDGVSDGLGRGRTAGGAGVSRIIITEAIVSRSRRSRPRWRCCRCPAHASLYWSVKLTATLPPLFDALS